MKTASGLDPPTSIDKESSKEMLLSVNPSSVVGHRQAGSVEVKMAWWAASVGELLESNAQMYICWLFGGEGALKVGLGGSTVALVENVNLPATGGSPVPSPTAPPSPKATKVLSRKAGSA